MTWFLMGLMGACGLVLGLHFLNPGMMSPEQVQDQLKEYVIGLVPRVPGKVPPHDYVLEKPGSSLVEAITSLKFSLALSDPDHPVKALQITSSVPEEGKTSLAITLARVTAASGQKVLLVDGDLRRSSIRRTSWAWKAGTEGLSDLVVSGQMNLSDYVIRDEKSKVDYMSPGTAQFANATDIFSSHRMEDLIAEMKNHYDLIIVDSPPVMAVADARIIGRSVDKTLFVVRWEKTPRKAAATAVDLLKRAGVGYRRYRVAAG